MFHDEVALLLNRVASRLVERKNLGEITTDLPQVQLAERDGGGDEEQPLPVRALLNKAHAGDDLMGAALELHQHPLGIRLVGGFAENLGAEADDGIGAKNDLIGKLLRRRVRLAIGVDLRGFGWREVLRGHFGHLVAEDGELNAHLPQQFRTAR